MLTVLDGIKLGNGGDSPETPLDGFGYADKLSYRNM